MARRVGVVAVVVIILALVARWVDAPRDGARLSPHGTGPAGLGALVDSLERLGADVTVDDRPPTDGDVVLLLRDQLDDDERDALRSWVAAGGRLVVTDPGSPLTPDRAGRLVPAGRPTLERGCDVAALADVDRVEPRSPVGYDVAATDGSLVGCFGETEAAWLTVAGVGDGVVVSLGGSDVWLNRDLDAADHPQLAMALLAPEPDTRVGVTELRRPQLAEAGLRGLVPESAWWALAQLAVAAGLAVAWRFPRDAIVTRERPAVALAGSELVLATADLRHQRQAREQAAASLRRAARHHLVARLGVRADTDDAALADLAHRRSGVDPAVARRALGGDAGDDTGLVAQGVAAARLRRALERPVPPAAAGLADRSREPTRRHERARP